MFNNQFDFTTMHFHISEEPNNINLLSSCSFFHYKENLFLLFFQININKISSDQVTLINAEFDGSPEIKSSEQPRMNLLIQ